MKRNVTVVTALLLMLVLCACGSNKKTSPTPAAATAKPEAAANTPVADELVPKDEKPTPTPLLDTDQMLENAKEDVDELIDGEDPLLEDDKGKIDTQNEKQTS